LHDRAGLCSSCLLAEPSKHCLSAALHDFNNLNILQAFKDIDSMFLSLREPLIIFAMPNQLQTRVLMLAGTCQAHVC
jgi:hypothetical protein